MEILPRVSLEAVLITGLIGGLFAFSGLIVIGIAVFVRGRAAASQRWPMVLGQVIDSRIISSTSSEGGTTYEPRIQYAYDLGGQAYHSSRVAFGGFVSTGNPRDSEKYTSRYPVGAVVQVYYNPTNPQDATLERRAGSAGFLIALGGLFLVVGCGLGGIPAALYVARLFVQ